MPTTNTYSAADLVAFIPEIWTNEVLKFYFDATVAADFFRDLSEFGQGGGDIFHVADIFTNNFSSSAKSNAAEVTLVSPTTTDITITVNTWREVSYLIEDMELQHMGVGKVAAIFDAFSEQAGGRLADDLEDNLLALWSGISTTVGSTGSAVTDLQVRQAIRNVDDNPTPRRDRAWFIHPRVFWDQIIGLQKYYDASQAGWQLRGGPVISGGFGQQVQQGPGIKATTGLYGKIIAVVKSVLNTKELLTLLVFNDRIPVYAKA